MLLRLKLYYNDPIMMKGNGTPYTEIEIPETAWKQIDYYKQFHCLNCERLAKCKLRKRYPMIEPELRFYTCSLFAPRKPIAKPKNPIVITDPPTKERLKELAWALEAIIKECKK
jgi:hypothetical protein